MLHGSMAHKLDSSNQSGPSQVSLSASEVAAALPSSEICVICLDLISDRATSLPCRHDHFDFSCLGRWLQQHQSCPLCKSTVHAVHYATGEGSNQTFHLPDDNPALPKPRIQPHRNHSTRQHPINDSRHKRFTDAALTFRPLIYHHNLPSQHIGSNTRSRHLSITPSLIASDTHLLQRARTWIRRELSLFPFLHSPPTKAISTSPSPHFRPDIRATNREYLLEYIISVLQAIDLKGSQGQAVELLSQFLGKAEAKLFTHELEAWLRSPYELVREWDQVVQYRLPDGRVVNGVGTVLCDPRRRKE